MLILGINDTHDASACLIKDGELIGAIQEERIARIKNIGGFPGKAIKELLRSNNIDKNDIDYVAVANTKPVHLNFWNIHSEFTIDDHFKLSADCYSRFFIEKKKVKIRRIFPNFISKYKSFYPIKKIPFVASYESSKKMYKNLNRLRLKYISKFININEDKIFFFDHHECHSMYAYFLDENRKSNCIIVTIDGGGDAKYNSITKIKNNNLKVLASGKDNLLGKFYSSITLLLGMNPARHHYKVMGLAPYAKKKYKDKPLKIFLKTLKIKGIKFIQSNELTDHFLYFRNKLKNLRFDSIAGALQDFLEIRLSQLFININKKTKLKYFIFSGGVANNVKANLHLSKINAVNKIFIPPGPGDENLSIGAAFNLIVKKFGFDKSKKIIKKIDNAYWGDEINDHDIQIFKSHKLIKKNYTIFKDTKLKKTAKILSNGKIVAFCQGKMEYGSRALGHRSFLAHPSNLVTKKKLNDLIKKRDFWMPFTPSILSTDFKKYIKNPKKNNSNFMTKAFETTSEGKSKLLATVHPEDQTVRPQCVYPKTCETYFKLLKEFKKITGIGALLNTSLNLHEKPIIYKPIDIVNEFFLLDKNLLEYIYVNDSLYVLKKKDKIKS